MGIFPATLCPTQPMATRRGREGPHACIQSQFESPSNGTLVSSLRNFLEATGLTLPATIMADACTGSLEIIRSIIADLPAIREAAASKKLESLRATAIKLAELSGNFRAAGLGCLSSNADVQQRQLGSDAENLKLQNLKSQQSSIKSEISRSQAVPTKQLDKICLPTAEEYAASADSGEEPLPSDQHARTLALLRFELRSRKAALRQEADTQSQRRSVALRREDSLAFLTGLPAQLAAIKAATAPLGQQLGAPIPPPPSAPTALCQQPVALRNVFTALHAMQGAPVPALAIPSGSATITSVQVCPADAALTAVHASRIPSAYGTLLQQLQREAHARREAAGPAPKLLRAAAAAPDKRGGQQLPPSAQAIFEPHTHCICAQLQCTDTGVEAPAAAAVSLHFLWLPHVAAVFVAATSDGQPCALEHLFPGDSGLFLPAVPASYSSSATPGGLHGLPVPAAIAARPFVWAQAMAGIAVQGAVGVWLPSDSDATGTAAASYIAPTARSAVAALGARVLQGAHAAAAVRSLLGCCNATGAQGIIPASPSAQAAVRRLRTAASALLASAPGTPATLPASARLESVRQLAPADVSAELAQVLQLALDDAKQDLRSELAAALASSTAWRGEATGATATAAVDSSSSTALATAMSEDEWVVTEDEQVDGQLGVATPAAGARRSGAGAGASPALPARLIHCCMVLPCTLRVQVLLICGPSFPASAPVVLLLAAPAAGGTAAPVTQHSAAASIQQRLALDDLSHELNACVGSILGEEGTSVQDVLRLLQSAVPLAVEAATETAGPEAAQSAWRSLLKGRARRLRLLSLVSGV